MTSHPPIRSIDDLHRASADQIAKHLAWEVRRLIQEQEASQLEVAERIGYASSAGAFSRWLNGRDVIPHAKAKALDEQYPDFGHTLPGQSFTSLREELKQRRQGRFQSDPDQIDVFIASPMASAGGAEDGYRNERSAALQLAETLGDFCGFERVHYSGATIEGSDVFESPTLSIEANSEALYRARFFVLLALERPVKPSGIYVEAGMALALRKPSVYFVPNQMHLPWMLRTIGEHKSPHLPEVSVQPVHKMSQVITLVRRHRRALFTRLES